MKTLRPVSLFCFYRKENTGRSTNYFMASPLNKGDFQLTEPRFQTWV
jgi:hypothetical protein